MYTTEQLCEDVIEEVLLRLPVKTLFRCKLLSKTWRSIITSRKFAKRHYCHSVAKTQSPGNKNPKFYFLLRIVNGDEPARFITSISLTHDKQDTVHENIFSPYLESMYAWNCSPPLFSIGLGLYIVKFRPPSIALWNPATREIKVLSRSPFYESGKDCYYFSFGQAEFMDDTLSYKVGFLSYRNEDWPYFKLELYDSSSDSWKVLSSDIGYDRSWHPDGINLKRTLHLLSVPTELNAYIITFDYSSEVFGRMEVPALPPITGRYYDFNRSFLTLFHDRFLCLVVFWRTVQGDAMFFDVWVMSEYGVMKSWVMEGTIGPVKDNLIMLNYWRSTGGVFLEPRDKGSRICMYSCASSPVKKLSVPSNTWENMFVFEHKESLVSIHGTSDETQTQQLY
ncbi:unnamed protein product [Rhodiola kirilowii]